MLHCTVRVVIKDHDVAYHHPKACIIERAAKLRFRLAQNAMVVRFNFCRGTVWAADRLCCKFCDKCLLPGVTRSLGPRDSGTVWRNIGGESYVLFGSRAAHALSVCSV
jgi:hypothetical protein